MSSPTFHPSNSPTAGPAYQIVPDLLRMKIASSGASETSVSAHRLRLVNSKATACPCFCFPTLASSYMSGSAMGSDDVVVEVQAVDGREEDGSGVRRWLAGWTSSTWSNGSLSHSERNSEGSCLSIYGIPSSFDWLQFCLTLLGDPGDGSCARM